MPETAVLNSRTDLETRISRAMIRFEKEYMGRGPLETKTYVLDDMVVIRLKDVLTPAERKLIETQRDRSAYLVKQARNELLAAARPMLEAVVHDITGAPVQSIHTDISTRTGERIIVVTLKTKLPSIRCSNDEIN
jgi:uncharacterized protein YbcI